MTLENITTDRIRAVDRALQDALFDLGVIRSEASRGDITIKDAAARINRIGAEIEKAIYPEKHNHER